MKIPVTAALAAAVFCGDLAAQIAVSANDNKVTLVDGVVTTVRNPPPDTVTVLDLGVSPPRIVGEVQAPTSVIGPPSSVAVAPDGSIAIVTAAMKVDPGDPSRTVPDDRVTVIDLQASPPAVSATLRAGNGASGVSINPTGTLALVANRNEGTISVFTIAGKTVRPAGKVDLGAPESGPSSAAFSRNGRLALVTRNNDSLISVIAVDGTGVTYTKTDFAAGLKPYPLDVSRTDDVAVVGSIGAGATGGVDTVGVIDLSASPPRTVDQVAVGAIAEGLGLSADGQHVAVTVMNGSNAQKSSPFFTDHGLLKVLRLSNKRLTVVAEAPIGQWCQGVVWSRDGRTIAVQCVLQRELQLFTFDGARLTRAGKLEVSGGPSGIGVSR